jgi:hypothetical protein
VGALELVVRLVAELVPPAVTVVTDPSELVTTPMLMLPQSDGSTPRLLARESPRGHHNTAVRPDTSRITATAPAIRPQKEPRRPSGPESGVPD